MFFRRGKTFWRLFIVFMVSWICIESLHYTSFARPFCAVAAVFLANFRVDQVWNMETYVRVMIHWISCLAQAGAYLLRILGCYLLFCHLYAIHSSRCHLLKFQALCFYCLWVDKWPLGGCCRRMTPTVWWEDGSCRIRGFRGGACST